MPTTRPDTAFVDGICSACLNFLNRPKLNWEQRQKELIALLEKHDGKCIVPSSGGKDSHFQLLTLLELGATPTIVTASTCMLSDIGRKNIDNLARFATTIEVSPNKTVRAKLNRLGLQLVGDGSWPEHASIFSTPFRMSVALNIPLIFFGESPQREYGGPLGSEEVKQMTREWTSEYGGFLGLRASDFVGMDGITEHEMADYELPPQEEMDRIGLEAHFLGQYLPWDSHANAAMAVDHGFITQLPSQYNWWDHENLDNYSTGPLHDYLGMVKYGYGRLCAQISIDIRMDNITRDEAMKIVQERDGIFPMEYMGYSLNKILHRIQMGGDEFIEVCNQYMNKELFLEDEIRWGQKLTLKEFA